MGLTAETLYPKRLGGAKAWLRGAANESRVEGVWEGFEDRV
jgi:hypothetical protein